MEKTGFKDPARSNIKEENKKSPWNFDQPPYDERTSCYVNAGSEYGVGKTQPVGRKGNPKTTAPCLPANQHNLESDHIHRGRSTNVEVPEEK